MQPLGRGVLQALLLLVVLLLLRMEGDQTLKQGQRQKV
jgi:hypothetical protein